MKNIKNIVPFGQALVTVFELPAGTVIPCVGVAAALAESFVTELVKAGFALRVIRNPGSGGIAGIEIIKPSEYEEQA